MEYFHPDVMVQSVDDIDLPVELIAVYQQFEPFGVLRSIQLDAPYRQCDYGEQGHPADSEYGPVQCFDGILAFHVTIFLYRYRRPWARCFLSEKDRKSTRLNSSHEKTSYPVVC